MKNSLLLALFAIICFPLFTSARSHISNESPEAASTCDNVCSIENIHLSSMLECVNDSTYKVDFEYSIDNECWDDSISVFINEEFQRNFDGSNGAIYLNNLNSNSPGATDRLKLCILGNPESCKTFDYPKPNCGPDTCRIGEVIIKYDYNGYDDLDVIIGIFNNDSDGFINYDLYIDGQLRHTYGYSQSELERAVIALQTGIEYNYQIVDSNNDRCFTSGTIYYDYAPVDNSCRIENIEVQNLACNNNGTFNMEVSYDIENPSNNFVSVFLNGVLYNSYENNGTLNIVGIQQSENNETSTLTICSYGEPDCCSTIDYAQPQCNIICEIPEFEISYECGFGGFYTGIINFSESKSILDVYIDNEYFRTIFPSNFNSSRAPLGEFINGTQHTYRIVERNKEICSVEGDLFWQECTEETQPCPDVLIKIDSVACKLDGTYNIFIQARYDYVFNANPTISINQEPAYLGINQSVTPNPDSEYDIIEVCLDENRTCCTTIEFKQPDCLNTQQCKIYSDIGYSCWGDQYTAIYNGLADFVEAVDVYIDGEFETSFTNINFTHYYLGPYDIGETHTLRIVSQLDEECFLEEEFGIITDCNEVNPAKDAIIEVESIECNEDGTYNLTLSHDFFENGFDCLDLSIRGETCCLFHIQTIWEPGVITITNLNLNNINLETYLIKIDPIGISNASQSITFQLPECAEDNNACNITIQNADLVCAGGNTDEVFLNLNVSADMSGYQVFVNEALVLEVESTEQLVNLIPITTKINEQNTLKITRTNNLDCFAEIEIEGIDCSVFDNSCRIENIEVQSLACNNNGTFNMEVSYDIQNPPNNFLDVSLNGVSFGTHENNGMLDLRAIRTLENDETATITICTSGDTDCCSTIEYTQPQCDFCNIRTFDANFLCDVGDSDQVFLYLNGYTHPDGGGYQVFVNGFLVLESNSQGPFLELIPISTDIDGQNTIRITNTNNPYCFLEFELDGIDCSEHNNTCNLAVEQTYECGFGEYYSSFLNFSEETSNILEVYVDNELIRVVPSGFSQSVLLGEFANGIQHTYHVLQRDLETCFVEGDIFWQECSEDTQPCPDILIEIDSVNCNLDGTYSFVLTPRFDFTANQSPSTSINGESTTFFRGVQFVTPNPDSEFDIIEVCLDENRSCCTTLEFMQPDCDEIDCNIAIHSATLICDVENTNQIFLDLDASADMNGYQIYVNEVLVLEIESLGQLFDLIPIATDIVGLYTIKITSANNPDCYTEIEIDEIECIDTSEIDCLVEEIEIFNIDCIGTNEYSMSVDFQVVGDVNIPFTFYLNGNLLSTTLTDILPLDLVGLTLNDSIDIETITICIDELEDCCFDFTFESPNCLFSAVDDTLLDGVDLSPNPTRNIININHIPNNIIGLNIIDNLGRSMIQMEAQSDMQIDVSTYAEGIYTVQFFTADNKVMNKRFVKMN